MYIYDVSSSYVSNLTNHKFYVKFNLENNNSGIPQGLIDLNDNHTYLIALITKTYS